MFYKDRRKSALARMFMYLALLLVLVPVVYMLRSCEVGKGGGVLEAVTRRMRKGAVPLRVDYSHIRVLETRNYAGYEAGEGMKFVRVSLPIISVSSEGYIISAERFRLIDDQKRAYPPEDFSPLILQRGKEFMLGAGDTVFCVLVFRIPQGAKGERLYYPPGR
ncbi:MAG TPA: hypothetical protein EYP61_00065 [Candidatus Latescibacteria bacterium]|nr:hypothetical protein [Candidatus Latescibacterota bacterium]